MRVGVIGDTGRMGRLIVERLHKDSFYSMGLGFSRTNQESLFNVVQDSELLIDFSAPQVTLELLEVLYEYPKPILIGTSGLDLFPKISFYSSQLSQKTSVVVCANTSLGACMQNMLVRMLASYLDSSYDIRVREVHHRNKQDVVSGTAKRLVQTIVQAKQDVYGEEYHTMIGVDDNCQPMKNKIEVHPSRVGHIFGEHEVSFIHDEEEITIRHTAYSRKVFVDGVMRILHGLRRIQWKPGLYTAEDFFNPVLDVALPKKPSETMFCS